MDIKKEKVPSVTRAPYNALNSISKGSYQETDRIGSSLSFIVIFIAFKSGSLAAILMISVPIMIVKRIP